MNEIGSNIQPEAPVNNEGYWLQVSSEKLRDIYEPSIPDLVPFMKDPGILFATDLLATLVKDKKKGELKDRWFHILGVIQNAIDICLAFPPEDRSVFIASAVLHDGGYYLDKEKQITGWHPIDMAYYLQYDAKIHDPHLAYLILNHSGASHRFHLSPVALRNGKEGRNVVKSIVERINVSPCDELLAGLTYCDLKSGSKGKKVLVKERLISMCERLWKTDEAFMRSFETYFSTICWKVLQTEQRLIQCGLLDHEKSEMLYADGYCYLKGLDEMGNIVRVLDTEKRDGDRKPPYVCKGYDLRHTLGFGSPQNMYSRSISYP